MNVLLLFSSGGSAASAETLGFNLRTGTPNDSVCRFKPEVSYGQTETRYCSVVQRILDEDYAAGRLDPYYDSTVVGWSVITGPRSSNTGKISLALRTGKLGGPIYQGPEVMLPDVSPGTRVHFNENLPIEEGSQIALRIGITTRGNAEEAGAPLAFSAPGVGITETSLGGSGEPWGLNGGGMSEANDHQALLLETQVVSTEDTSAPVAKRRFAARQDLARGARLQVRSSEGGAARATAKLRIAGLKRTFSVASKGKKVRPKIWTSLHLPLRGRVLMAVKAAEAEGREVTLKGRVRVVDGAGNSTGLLFRVKGR
ncbi:MAG TPA: hypothetical protein VFY75_00475 [Solirubrobacterales bacterium]|nr:hypothetical protein [Solirubrobacterales bacterium]